MAILDTTRKDSVVTDSKLSEVELISTREEFADYFNELNQLKRKINDEKVLACKDIDAKYADDLKDLEGNYALLLKMVS